MSATGSFVTAIDPATSTITVSPALAVLPGANDPIVLVANNVPIDDQERQSSIDNFFTIEGPVINIGTNGLFPQFRSTAGTATNIECSNFQPFSTTLIGNRLQAASGAISGEIRTIINVVSSAVAPSEIYDTLVVSPAFSAPAGAIDFNILPAEDLFTPNKQQAVGGVYTGINYPESFASGISYPAHANLLYAGSVYEIGASRESGIVQEYVEYSSESDNIYTLDTPFYPRYDHPPGSTFIMGANTFTTQGDGTDYRPYLFGSFFSLLFGSVLVAFNSLFRAAGIESKSETTELGN